MGENVEQLTLLLDRTLTFFERIIPYFGLGNPVLIALYKLVLAIGCAYIVWFIAKRVLTMTQKRLQTYRFFHENEHIFDIGRKSFKYILFLTVGTFVLRTLNLTLLEKPLQAIFIVLLAIPVKDFATIALEYLQKRIANKTETKIDNIIFDLLSKFAGVIILVVAVMLALDMLGINVMPFVAGAGVAGIAIGFAAKDTLSNLIAGVLLIVDRPFEIGDRIEIWSAPIDSATWGDVIDIGLRATKIKTTDNIVIIIPNNEIMKRDIVNYTIISSQIRIRINIGIAYDADMNKAKKIILGVAAEIPEISSTPAPKVVVRNFGESAVDLQLRVWIRNARKRMDTISEITDQVKTRFDEEKIEIPYPKRDITVVERKTEK